MIYFKYKIGTKIILKLGTGERYSGKIVGTDSTLDGKYGEYIVMLDKPNFIFSNYEEVIKCLFYKGRSELSQEIDQQSKSQNIFCFTTETYIEPIEKEPVSEKYTGFKWL